MAKGRVMAIIPAFNEEKAIGQTVDSVKSYVDKVVVINDGSTDQTKEIALEHGATVVSYNPNMGKGTAIYIGTQYFLKSGFDFLFTIDGDGQHRPEYIPKFMKAFQDPTVDMVIASRFGTVDWVENMPFLRKLSNLLSRFGLWILYNGFVVEDPQNGYRAYRNTAVKVLDFRPKKKGRYGFEAETEILIDARIKGMKIATIHLPSLYFEDRVSKFSLFRDTWTIPGVMLKNFFKRKPWLYRRRFK
ncbi:MAG: glycosyltransferase family 2 protein [Methanobacteriota archaeon]|nr:MAG: glycosyltransferase family 2 protein [Euryarchaeota archaeon]